MPISSVIDTHVHLWDPTVLPTPWLMDIPTLNQPFVLAEYAHDTAEAGVRGIVFVETDVAPQLALLEAEWSVSLALHTTMVLGIIAAAPLEYGIRTHSYLMALNRLGGPIKGVRRNMHDEADPHFCLRAYFIAGVQVLQEVYHVVVPNQEGTHEA